MVSPSSLLLTALILTLTCPLTLAWGGPGHIATAFLAQSLFHPSASLLSTTLLPDFNGSIAPIASWADAVRNTNNIPYYPWSAPFHYVNTPSYDCHYIPSRDCPTGQCVDGAIHNYTTLSLDPSTPYQVRREAFEFLVHFIGDLHQPLHAGFAGGANGIIVRFNNATGTTNLHSLWDSGLISYRVNTFYNRSYTAWQDDLLAALSTSYKDEVPLWTQCNTTNPGPFPCSAEWVQESSTYCCSTAYLDDDMRPMYNGPTYPLSLRYYDRNIDLLEKRILQAGVRMAFVLNSIAASLYDTSSSSGAAAAVSSSMSSDSAMSSSAPSSSVSSSDMPSSSMSSASAVSSTSASSSSSAEEPSSSSSSGEGPVVFSTSPPAAFNVSSSTGAVEPEKESSSSVLVIVGVVVVLAVVAAVVAGLLYWRKQKYGLSGWFESVDSRSSSARFVDDEDTTAGYSRVV